MVRMSTHKRKVSDQDQSPESLEPSMSKRKYLPSTCSDDEDEKKVESKNGLRSPSFSSHNKPAEVSVDTFSSHNKPAELFRKDLISAMKLADSESLQLDEYFFISDPWKQEWERGVQVPVNLTSIPELVTRVIRPKAKSGDFKIPRKQLHACQDETFKQGNHELTGMQQLSEQVVRYDLDDRDVCWISRFNEEQEKIAEPFIHEWTMERVIEELENNCHENMKKTIKTEEGLGIEYDEDVICDVCRSPDGEDSNEMVFCDGCDICIHQACYGIQTIPEGTWLCRTCALGIKPQCILCPRSGGAMKSTRSGTKWAHVSCALWIPEVSIGCVEKMEPITKISQIPASRWGLICCLCKERLGACIQCSVKTCKTAFHVTCAFKNGLDMRTMLDDTDKEDGVKLKAYCPKHSRKRDRCHSDSDPDSPRKETSPRKDVTPRKELTIEEMENLRIKKLKRLEEEFYRVVDRKVVANKQQVDREIVEAIYVYWKLKRKSNFNQPLLTPKTEEEDLLEKQQEDSLLARMKMFVRLRQDLERVRNLSYMVSKREKTKRQYRKIKENVFYAQLAVLTDTSISISCREVKKVVNMCHDKSIYDNEHAVLPSFSSDYLSVATTDFKQECPSTASEMSPMSFTDYDSSRSTSRRRSRIKQRPNKNSIVISDPEESSPDFGSVCSSDSIRPRRSRNNIVHTDPISTSLRSRHNSGQSDRDLKRKPLRSPVILSERSVFDEVRTEKSVYTPPKHDITRNVFSTLASLVNSPPEIESNNNVTPIVEHGRTRSASLKSPSKHSQEFKEELDGLLQKSKLIVADTVREKVQAKLLKSSRLKSPYLNGFHDKSQKKLEQFFRNGRKSKYNRVNLFARNETGSADKHECTNVITTRILNELSPTRDRLENAWFGSNSSLRGYKIPKISSAEKNNASIENAPSPQTRSVRRRIETDIESSMKERIFENVDREISISRSSHSTTPESVTSSYGSYQSHGDSDSRLFRSSGEQKDAFVDVENVYEEENLNSLTGKQRVTRSHENMKITRNLKRSKLGECVTKAQIL